MIEDFVLFKICPLELISYGTRCTFHPLSSRSPCMPLYLLRLYVLAVWMFRSRGHVSSNKAILLLAQICIVVLMSSFLPVSKINMEGQYFYLYQYPVLLPSNVLHNSVWSLGLESSQTQDCSILLGCLGVCLGGVCINYISYVRCNTFLEILH